ncbi:hypothetical protein [Botryobacter ruber]|uniref:hypothetical protein n=1 Tax=Botryobacter ruber TaxID=2171629 RepID=UPI000E0BC58B|nr:hypothetical protein [Botryobacter ruber]
MPKFKFSFLTFFLLYLVLVLGYFVYAGMTGTRMLGDDTEQFDPSGPDRDSGGRRVRTHRFYHK